MLHPAAHTYPRHYPFIILMLHPAAYTNPRHYQLIILMLHPAAHTYSRCCPLIILMLLPAAHTYSRHYPLTILMWHPLLIHAQALPTNVALCCSYMPQALPTSNFHAASCCSYIHQVLPTYNSHVHPAAHTYPRHYPLIILMLHPAAHIFCLFVLMFYGSVNPMGACRAPSVYLNTLLQAGLVLLAVNQYCAHSFARNWQMPFLNQWKGENDHRKYFMINLHERMLLTQQG